MGREEEIDGKREKKRRKEKSKGERNGGKGHRGKKRFSDMSTFYNIEIQSQDMVTI